MDISYELGILSYLLEETISCYEGLRHPGCEKCPACNLRNQGIQEFKKMWNTQIQTQTEEVSEVKQ